MPWSPSVHSPQSPARSGPMAKSSWKPKAQELSDTIHTSQLPGQKRWRRLESESRGTNVLHNYLVSISNTCFLFNSSSWHNFGQWHISRRLFGSFGQFFLSYYKCHSFLLVPSLSYLNTDNRGEKEQPPCHEAAMRTIAKNGRAETWEEARSLGVAAPGNLPKDLIWEKSKSSVRLLLGIQIPVMQPCLIAHWYTLQAPR